MAKKIDAYIKLQVPAGAANPSPPVGPALGQHGVNIMEFCKAFNAKTQSMESGLPIPVVITVFNDKSFTFITKTPPASVLLKKAAGLKSGSGRPNTEKVGTEYEVDNSAVITNFGERRCLMRNSEKGSILSMKWQVVDVHKPLLSVGKMNEQGHECVCSRRTAPTSSLQMAEADSRFARMAESTSLRYG